MTRTLVTGANGFIGHSLVAELVARGITVRGAVRRAAPLASGIECSVIGEIGAATDWHEPLADATSVVHLAARAHVLRETATDSLAKFRAINTAGTLNLARQAAEAGVRRFVFVSTIKVNGEGRNTPYTELDFPSPQEPYALSKWEAEQGLRDIATRTGMEVTILRPSLVYGPGVGANFLHLMQAVDRGWPLPLGGVKNRRSLIYLGNLVDAITVCLTNPAAANKTFLLEDGDDVSTPELIRRLAIALGRPAKLFSTPSVLLKTASFVLGKQKAAERLLGSLTLDGSAIQRALRWSPPYSMAEGLDATAAWYRGAQLVHSPGAGQKKIGNRMAENPSNVVWHGGHIMGKDRESLLGQARLTIWLTGLSAAGKSTLAFALEKELVAQGRFCYVLDGDNVRHGLNKNLGFSPADRSENIRRIAEVARLMNDAGLIVITAFISPFISDREMARRIIGPEFFREVYVSTALAVCESRDPKGMYTEARAGKVVDFTGISSPYEAPESPDLVIDTSQLPLDQAVSQLIALALAGARDKVR